MKHLFSLLFFCFSILAAQAQAPTLSLLWETDTLMLKTPESVLYNAKSNSCFVACMALRETGDGYISIIDTKGNVTEPKWLSGLDDPKGMAIAKGKLYVADNKNLLEIDMKTRTILNKYTKNDIIMLNDVTATAKGQVFVSDSRGNKLYCLSKGSFEVWSEDPLLVNPNGVLAEKKTLRVACSGNGKLYSIALKDKSKKMNEWSEAANSADGIEQIPGSGHFVSCWRGELYFIDLAGKSMQIMDTRDSKTNAADIDYIPSLKTLFLPTFGKNSVKAYKVQ